MAGKVFSGNVRIAIVNALGVMQGGYLGPVNCTKLELVTPAPETIDQISRQNGTAGQLVSRAQIPKTTTLQLAFDDTADQRIMAYALNGVVQAYSQSSGSVTHEAVSAKALGDWVPLASIHVSSVVVTDAATDLVTYVAGTDYVVDANPGLIRPLAGGAITANEALHVSYSKAAVAGNDVQGSVSTGTLLRVHGHLQNLVDGGENYFICPIFQALSSGNNDLFGKNMLVAAIAGAMFLPPIGSAANTETGGAPYLLRSIT
jgi:hypothetical protein